MPAPDPNDSGPNRPTLEESRAAIQNLEQSSEFAASSAPSEALAGHPETEGELTNSAGPASDPMMDTDDAEISAHDLRGYGSATQPNGSVISGNPVD